MKAATCSAVALPRNPPSLASPIPDFEVRAILDQGTSLTCGLMVARDGRRAVLVIAEEGFRPGQREEFAQWARALADVAAVADMPPVIGFGATDTGHAYLACAAKPSLSDHLRLDGQPHPSHVRRIGATVADTLAAAHSYGLTHGAVCPSTVMIEGDWAWLGGFGATAPAIATPLGLWPFAAPEHRRNALLGEPAASTSADVYALAATLCVALIGAVPWSQPATWADAVGLPADDGAPDWVLAIRDALRDSPDDRPNAEEFAAALRVPDESVDVRFHGAKADLRPLIPRSVRRLAAYSLAAMADDPPVARGRASAPLAPKVVRSQAPTTQPRQNATAVSRLVRPRSGADVAASIWGQPAAKRAPTASS